MNKLILFTLLALPISAQTVINMPSFTLSADATVAVQNWMLTQVASVTVGPTLTANINAGTTTVQVSDGAQFKANGVGRGFVIDNEEMDIVSIAGNTLTVVRGNLGTTAKAHTSGASITILLWPTVQNALKNMVFLQVAQIMAQGSYPTAATQNAAKAAADVAIQAAVAGSVQ